MNMVLGTYHVIFKRFEERETLNVGSILYMAGTGAPLGRVDGYYFGSITSPDYVLRVDSDIQLTDKGVLETFVDEAFVEYIDEEELYQRFHDPVRKDFDIFDEGEVIDCESTDTKRRMSNHYDSHVPHLQYHHYRGSQIREPNLVPQVSTLFAGDWNYFNQQPFGMHPQPSLNSAAPMVYNLQQQDMLNQQHQMGLTMITAGLMMTDQISRILQGGGSGSYGIDLNYFNQQQFGLPQPRSELNFNPQTQPMQFPMFQAGPSSNRGRRRRRSRARRRERRGQD